MNANKAPSRTGRSHEENQERAYIAASRRADRSIEARLQSARMASEIHRRRTGRGFRITEEIVVKEEMYEEEEDDLPRSLRVLGPAVNTATAEFNWRVQAYLSNKIALASMAAGLSHEQWMSAHPTNRAFAESFPTHDEKTVQRRASMAQSGVTQPQQQQQAVGSPRQPEPMSYSSPSPRVNTLDQLPDRRHSTPVLSRMPSQHPASPAPATPTFRQMSMTPTQMQQPLFPDGVNLNMTNSSFTGEPSMDVTQMLDLMRFNNLPTDYSQGMAANEPTDFSQGLSPANESNMFTDLGYDGSMAPPQAGMNYMQDNFMGYEEPAAQMAYGAHMFPTANDSSVAAGGHNDDIQWTSFVNDDMQT